MLWIYRVHKFLTRPVLRQWISESENRFPKHSVQGITVYCSDQLLPTLELTLAELRRQLPEVHDLIVRQIQTIYAHPAPMGWLGFGNDCAFITSEEEEVPAFIWKECAGYLAAIAKINESITSGHASVIFRTSRTRKQVDEFERNVLEKLDSAPQVG